MKKMLLILIGLLLFAEPSFAETKEADLAGSWYPDSGAELRTMLNGFLDGAQTKEIEGEIIGLISPHAGYRYSGPVAAYGFKSIRGRKIDTVIVIGFNHRLYHRGIAVCDFDFYKTPLGEIPIDKEISNELIAIHDKIYPLKKAFYNENSTEMQIPFLQMVLSDFKLVIIHLGEQSLENCKILAEALYNVLKNKRNFVFVASTDLSHYLSYDEAKEIDSFTVSQVEGFDAMALFTESSIRSHSLMCGYGAVCTAMIASKLLGADKVEILKLANSGDVTFDKSGVVGYLSAAIVKSKIQNSKSKINPKSKIQNTKQGDGEMLNREQKEKLLKLARDSIIYYLKKGKPMSVEEKDLLLNKEMGAFVTLHKHGQLRGCIGNIIGKGPLYLTARDMAIESATGDPRFAPVTLDEMEEIDIEISVLSPLEKVNDPTKIEAGKHGVLVKNAFTSGVYLPQVATEAGWNRDEFMNSLCGHKAGMSPDAWKKGECEIYIFTAEVFEEKN